MGSPIDEARAEVYRRRDDAWKALREAEAEASGFDRGATSGGSDYLPLGFRGLPELRAAWRRGYERGIAARDEMYPNENHTAPGGAQEGSDGK